MRPLLIAVFALVQNLSGDAPQPDEPTSKAESSTERLSPEPATPQNRFGPEWTKVGTDEYRRMIEVPVVYSVAEKTAKYHVKLQNDELHVTETDGNGFGVRSRYGSFEVRKNDRGRPPTRVVRLGKVEYTDLNADGIIDSIRDTRGRQPKRLIRTQGRLVEVRGTKGDLRSGELRSLDGTTRYVFAYGRWMRTSGYGLLMERPGFYRPSAFGEPLSPDELPGEIGTDEDLKLQPPKETRERLAARWREVIGAVEIDDSLFEYLSLVSPQPESAFVKFKGEKLSVDLIRSSMSWMNAFLVEEANPYADMATIVEWRKPANPLFPDYPGMEDLPPEEPTETDRWMLEWERRQRQTERRQLRPNAPYLFRTRPTRYYLGTGKPGDRSLLLYEFESQSGDYDLRIIESNAAVLLRINRRNKPLDLSDGPPAKDVAAMLKAALRRSDFRLPGRLPPGTVFSNTERYQYHEYLQGKDHHSGSWSDQIIGFVTGEGVHLLFIKSSEQKGAVVETPFPAWPRDWLRRDLYQNDGETLVVGPASDDSRKPEAPGPPGISGGHKGPSAPRKKFGPEWTKVGDREYRRTIKLPVRRSAFGNTVTYALRLEKVELHFSEIDGNRGLGIHCRPYGTLEVRKDEQGRAKAFFISMAKAGYADLNADGIIDGALDSRGRHPKRFILTEGRFVEVRNTRRYHRSDTASSLDGETDYKFQDDRWAIVREPGWSTWPD